MRIFVLLPLLIVMGACSKAPVVESENEGKQQQEVKEEDKPAEPVAEVKPQLDGVNLDKLEEREGIVYLKGSDTPYTGKATSLYENGQKSEANLKDGKRDGLIVLWHENGQKALEQTYKDGEEISAKYWNRKGEPVDSFEEAEKE
jgi:antitoxin component YwqK of YwqJK toxin-antitoxin module